ncbi:hypothetical protein F4859DRAFT_524879 [Xylaria cf. heliscus]|nr:hypothetical protein F4859DRAFT_524879 [Xylaria cf. heliscus]
MTIDAKLPTASPFAFNPHTHNVEHGDLSTIDPAILQIDPPVNGTLWEQQQQPAWDELVSQAQPYESVSVPLAQDSPTAYLIGPGHTGVTINGNGQTINPPFRQSNASTSYSTPLTIDRPFTARNHTTDSEDAMQEHTSTSHVGIHFAVSESPFKCSCGKEFTLKANLNRHTSPVPKFSCDRCSKVFWRKDGLKSHLERKHGYKEPRKTKKPSVPVCQFQGCIYSRGPDFNYLPSEEQHNNRPFDMKVHYRRHMRKEHNWSPFHCQVPGCDKTNKKGFFSSAGLRKHHEKKH